MIIKCAHCGNDTDKPIGHINRSNKKGMPIYCDRVCAGLGRRSGLSLEEKRAAKAEYDRQYRDKNPDKLKEKAKNYNLTEAGRATQKRLREKRRDNGKHAAYCRKPEQRSKEKVRRHIRLGQLEEKYCLVCESNKPKIQFTASRIYPDGRMYICKSCEQYHKEVLGQSTPSVIQAIVTGCDYRLTRKDVAKYPYFIEAKKYVILLNKLIIS